MGPVGHLWLPSAWPTPRLALTAPFVFSAPRLPCSLLLKPSDCAGLGQSLGPSPGCGCSASAELGFVPLPAMAGTSCAIPPWRRVPQLGAQLSGCVGSNPSQPGGHGCPQPPSIPHVPPSCGVSRTPGSGSSPPWPPTAEQSQSQMCAAAARARGSPKPLLLWALPRTMRAP